MEQCEEGVKDLTDSLKTLKVEMGQRSSFRSLSSPGLGLSSVVVKFMVLRIIKDSHWYVCLTPCTLTEIFTFSSGSDPLIQG